MREKIIEAIEELFILKIGQEVWYMKNNMAKKGRVLELQVGYDGKELKKYIKVSCGCSSELLLKSDLYASDKDELIRMILPDEEEVEKKITDDYCREHLQRIRIDKLYGVCELAKRRGFNEIQLGFHLKTNSHERVYNSFY